MCAICIYPACTVAVMLGALSIRGGFAELAAKGDYATLLSSIGALLVRSIRLLSTITLINFTDLPY